MTSLEGLELSLLYPNHLEEAVDLRLLLLLEFLMYLPQTRRSIVSRISTWDGWTTHAAR